MMAPRRWSPGWAGHDPPSLPCEAKVTMASDMCGRRVAVEIATTEEADAWGFMGKMVGGAAISGDTDHCTAAGKRDITVDSFATQTQADAALRSGRDDVGFLDRPVATYEVKVTGGAFQLGGQPCRVQAYGIALVAGAPLEKPIQDAVKYLINSGYYGQILKSWNVQGGAIPSSQVTVNNNSITGAACVPTY